MRKLEHQEVKQTAPGHELVSGRTRLRNQQREVGILFYVCADFLDIVWIFLQTIQPDDASTLRTCEPILFPLSVPLFPSESLFPCTACLEYRG